MYPAVLDVRVKFKWPKALLPVKFLLRGLLQNLDPVADTLPVIEVYRLLNFTTGSNAVVLEGFLSTRHPSSFNGDLVMTIQSAISELSPYLSSFGAPKTNLSERMLGSISLLVPKGSTSEIDFAARNNEIEVQLKRDRWISKNEIHILVMGGGVSGSAAALNKMIVLDCHMKQRYNDQATVTVSFKERIFTTLVRAMLTLLDAMTRMSINLSWRNRAHIATLRSLPLDIEVAILSQDIIDPIRSLWKDPAVQEFIHEFQAISLNQPSNYFLDSLDRISSFNYVPTYQDIALCGDIMGDKAKTVIEVAFKIGELTYKFFHIGVQHLAKKKWISSFENVTAVVFVVNMSEYDEVLYEDQTMNRMQEALSLFDSICNSRWFSKTAIILMMNEGDLLQEKLRRSPLDYHFPDYTGGDNYDAACEYLLHRFVSLNQNAATKQIYAYYESDDIEITLKFILGAIQDILLQLHLKECGLL
ncbi:hypothetical protein GYMLUDRAFT_244671 [Collybiopsis luxurians FD-317 M1]|uniref:Guanine nucleotide-binding protein subunit alpha n=1 Tax=Collybiopsis luxurians FD-317 M1 TaxID=944289 RepID=A0A0D0CNE5_9AGAR|nr:hypothetical protein GYMLUDRAFT_244671 [Collybiopsis luxurians FD-317 M1]